MTGKPAPGYLQRRLGRNVRVWRKAHGWTQVLLAEHVGIDRTYVCAIERGHRNVSLALVERLATRLGVSAVDLLTE